MPEYFQNLINQVFEGFDMQSYLKWKNQIKRDDWDKTLTLSHTLRQWLSQMHWREEHVDGCVINNRNCLKIGFCLFCFVFLLLSPDRKMLMYKYRFQLSDKGIFPQFQVAASLNLPRISKCWIFRLSAKQRIYAHLETTGKEYGIY